MQKELHDYLASLVDVETTQSLCRSISMIGPYLSRSHAQDHGMPGLTFANPVSAPALRQLASVKARRAHYRKFFIPKKSGGQREIMAPTGLLLDTLSALAFIFSELYNPPVHATAFVRHRSVVDNARPHCGHNYVLNLDLKDFFTTIKADDVERALTRISVPPLIAHELAGVCTYPHLSHDGRVVNVLPQGAPTSPVLSNICAMTLDRRLHGLARRFHLTYTRYADDMTFSSNHHVYHPSGEFMTECYKIINECGFTVNEAKTRLQKRGAGQRVTGLSVNQHVNVSRKYVKNLRAAIHHIALQETLSRHDVNVVRGKLNYLRMVKGNHDSTYQALLLKLNLALKGKHFE